MTKIIATKSSYKANTNDSLFIQTYNTRMKLWHPYSDILTKVAENNLSILISAIEYVETSS
jgi:hypothetical protein